PLQLPRLPVRDEAGLEDMPWASHEPSLALASTIEPMRLVLVLLGLALLIGGAGAATTDSGLYGVVRRGPTRPVCGVGPPCTAPAAGAVLVFWPRGHALARTRVHRNASY